MTAVPPPAGQTVYAVRWRRQTSRADLRIRFFTRQGEAERYAARLGGFGKDVALFVTAASWSEVTR